MSLKITLKTGLALFALLTVGTASAAGYYAGTINRIKTESTGEVWVYVNQAANNECGSKLVSLADPNTPGANRIYSALLAYQATARKVQFYIDACEGTYGKFTKIEDSD